ncbi:hypothetical protein B0H11DRAFT_1922382 [Mycena galericulata]|nr:hypothetical protein B0H11DRAFT_1922382 [Mycena galericulata]
MPRVQKTKKKRRFTYLCQTIASAITISKRVSQGTTIGFHDFIAEVRHNAHVAGIENGPRMITCIENRLCAPSLATLLAVDLPARSLQITPLGNMTFLSILDQVNESRTDQTGQMNLPPIDRTLGPTNDTSHSMLILESRRKRMSAHLSPDSLDLRHPSSPPLSDYLGSSVKDVILSPSKRIAFSPMLSTDQVIETDTGDPKHQQAYLACKVTAELTGASDEMKVPGKPSASLVIEELHRNNGHLDEIAADYVPILYQGDAKLYETQIFARLEARRLRNDIWVEQIQQRVDALRNMHTLIAEEGRVYGHGQA